MAQKPSCMPKTVPLHPYYLHFAFLRTHCRVFVRLSAGLLRQATYTTTRLGIYTILFEKMTSSDGRPPSFLMKVASSPLRTSLRPAVPAHRARFSLCRR